MKLIRDRSVLSSKDKGENFKEISSLSKQILENMRKDRKNGRIKPYSSKTLNIFQLVNLLNTVHEELREGRSYSIVHYKYIHQ